ncbi:hypothetical protein [Spiroplasma poulsonii]|uniref:hypothetical protein n=1 Tax=Spiroplasma poulsonii TaxID=2138 RepID=UPI000F8DB6C1|nr:hypothetical protein [Spiroplasma poulsonii]
MTEQWENWVFKTKLNFSLRAKYWKSKLQERILITPGKISDENGITIDFLRYPFLLKYYYKI